MAEATNENRRDPRYSLKSDHAFAEFDDPWDADKRWCGQLLSVSPAGVSLQVATTLCLQPQTALPEAILQVGECVMHGSIVVKNLIPSDDSTTTIGGLFYPRTDLDAAKLMALISGMEAIDTIWELQRGDEDRVDEPVQVPAASTD